jgi:hypothetical protein
MAFNIVEELQRSGPYFGAEQKPFDAVIIQVGIVDCCPRPWPIKFEGFLRRLPRGQRILDFFNGNYRFFLRFRKRPWVGPNRFRDCLETAIRKAGAISGNVFFIQIAPARHKALQRIPGLPAQIDRYNGLLAGLEREGASPNVRFLRPFSNLSEDAASDCMLGDGIHLTEFGHARICDTILEAFEKMGAPETTAQEIS